MTSYNNGSLSNEQVQELQTALNAANSQNNLAVDGKYGPLSSAAAGGLSAEAAYGKYVKNAGNSAASQNTATQNTATQNTATQNTATQNTAPVYTQPEIPAVGKLDASAMPKAEKADTSGMVSQLDQWLETAKQQQTGAIDYATNQGITELQRAEEDAQEQFQTQRNQIDIDEARALDNQALYAEARGDKGGIGQAQYGSVQNTAAQNRLTVNKAQTKLSTDTARQISDLRAQGEFEKADALLTLTQNYLSQLQQLQQWALSYNLSVDEFNASMQQWIANYNLSVDELNISRQEWASEFELSQAELTGMYQGNPTYAAQQKEAEKLAEAGWALLEAGIMPSESQLAQMGLTSSQASSLISAYQLAASSGGGGGGSSSGSGSGSSTKATGNAGAYSAVARQVGNATSVSNRLSILNRYKESLTSDEYRDIYAQLITPYDKGKGGGGSGNTVTSKSTLNAR